MSQDITRYHYTFSDEEIEKIEILAALDYSPRRIAIYLGMQGAEVQAFEAAANDANSYVYELIDRARIRQEADELIEIAKKAKSGKLDAQKRIDEVRRSRAFMISKSDIFGTFKSSDALDRLNSYLQNGGSVFNQEDAEESIYLDALLLLRDVDHNYGRNAAIEFARNHFKLKHARAVEMLNEVHSLFFNDKNIDKKALRHKYAYKLEQMGNFVFLHAETSQDAERAKNILMASASLLELDKPDPQSLPAELYIQPFNIFDLNAENTGLGTINRHAIAAEIDGLEVPMSVKQNLREDAMLDPLDIAKRLELIEKDYTDK